MNYELRIKKGAKTPDRKFEFRDKRVLVMGLGLHGGGIGMVKFLAKSGARLTVTDLRSQKILRPALKNLKKLKNIRYVLGRHRKEDFLKTDLIVKNPGVKPDSPFLDIARKKKIPVTSDVEIFFKSCPGKIIGVTGTRGKSTAAYLIWLFLKEKFKNSSRRVFLAGNIRKSALELFPKIRKEDVVVLELSSFQLHDLIPKKISPEIAVITNILKDHLNWHKNFQDYVRAKRQIFRSQKPGGLLFLDSREKTVQKIIRKTQSRIIFSRLSKDLGKITDRNLGRHYRGSVSLAASVARHWGVRENVIKKILIGFKGLPGRQEEIAKISGVHFVNDTTSTMPEASVAALYRLGKIARKIILIAGGQDKNLDFRKMASAIRDKVSVLILLPGTATKKLKKLLRIADQSELRIIEAKSMSEAVKKAAGFAKRGDFVVLSPGAASFGLFANEFDRGEKFIDAVNKLKGLA